jgi:hypothetical protein
MIVIAERMVVLEDGRCGSPRPSGRAWEVQVKVVYEERDGKLCDERRDRWQQELLAGLLGLPGSYGSRRSSHRPCPGIDGSPPPTPRRSAGERNVDGPSETWLPDRAAITPTMP